MRVNFDLCFSWCDSSHDTFITHLQLYKPFPSLQLVYENAQIQVGLRNISNACTYQVLLDISFLAA